MTPKEAFKSAFVARCVEEGMTTPEEIRQQAVKVAGLLDALSGLGRGALALGREGISTVKSVGIPLALAAPPILGAGLGYSAAKMTDFDDTDADELKKQELIEELHRQAETLSRSKRLRDMRAQKHRGGRRTFI